MRNRNTTARSVAMEALRDVFEATTCILALPDALTLPPIVAGARMASRKLVITQRRMGSGYSRCQSHAAMMTTLRSAATG